MAIRLPASRLVLALLILFPLASAVAGEEPLPETIDFNRDIRPIFSDNCFTCHGPDKNHREADLRIDTHEGVLAPRDGTLTVVPGKPQESELYRRLVTTDADERMPASGSGKGLSEHQIALIKRWIEQGAKWQGHWAYLPPKRPDVPATDNSSFVRNNVDHFILAELNKHHVEPSPEADRTTLIRRLSFDLTGLPPSWEEVDAFLNDKGPDAYEKLVDRLLASPHFGERMAMWWLDLVRFADTIGYHSDNPMRNYPYRDYVIRAFQSNKPFDRFSREQLAGDLLPNATIEQRVASGYNRLLMTTEEGGAQPKEYEQKYAADRVRNVSSVWLGATMACCQCHDHKFDPYTLRDFYSMAAYFADIQEAAVGAREVGIPIPTEQQEADLAQMDGTIARLEAALNAPIPQLTDAQVEWERQITAEVNWEPIQPETLTATSGHTLMVDADGAIVHGADPAATDDFVIAFKPKGTSLTGIRLEALVSDSLPAKGPGTASNGNFVLSEIVVLVKKPGKESRKITLSEAVADFSQNQFAVAGIVDGKPETGWAVLPETGKDHWAILTTSAPVTLDTDDTLTVRLEHQSPHAGHQLGRMRVSITSQTYPRGSQSLPEPLRLALAKAPDNRSTAEKETIAAHYRTITPLLAPVRTLLAGVRSKRDAMLASAPKCLVSVAGPPRTVRVLPRGNWLDESGEVVNPAVPGFLAGSAAGNAARGTRLDLANWLLAPENPLTARVVVNRLWKLYFGYGLARTLEDFGAQGEWPTHPELLDYLAVDFRENGWDMRRVIRQLVMSGAYRQSSLVAPGLKEKDPYNRLFARQSRFRLDAEMVRDNALAISGLLSRKVGGPSVKPYQPAGYWASLNFPPREWKNDDGASLYRRGMYTHWQRSFLHPSLLAFDAPSREECTVDRPKSNIPQQALVLLNDPTYVEAARVFAARMLKEGGSTTGDRIDSGFRIALSRLPTAEERAVLSKLYDRHREQYLSDAEGAKALLATGAHPVSTDLDPVELAAWTSVGRVLLNLHETITRN